MDLTAAVRHTPVRVRRRRAFTLIDLVLAMSILGVMLAIAVPRYGDSLARYRLEAAASRVSADLVFAQSRAKATGSRQAVVFDLASNQVQLPGCMDPDRPGAPYAVRLGESPYQATLVEANFAGERILTFDGYGVPLAGGTLAIQVGAARRTVSVNGQTGKVGVP